MDASSSSTFFTSSGVPQAPISVSQEEFALFHNIDRKLFSRLIFPLGRDPAESAQVMALWMWLEHAAKEYNFVHKLCVTLPDTLLNGIADESVVALNCIQQDDFHVDITNRNQDMPLFNALTKSCATLEFFHQNRLGIIRGITKLFNEVCIRAFDNLFPKPQPNRAEQMMLNAGTFRPYNPSFHNATVAAYDMVGVSNMGLFPNQRMYGEDVNNNPPSLGPYQHIHLLARAATRGDAALDYLRGVFDPYDLAAQRQILNEEMGDVLSRLNINDDQQEVEDVSADERTIFLTFSKGYPISEVEVREFFSRKFGDFIDGVFMQEVPAEEQPLYARLVVRSISSIPIVLDGKNKAKFSINGKHVWARKYVRKSKSPGEPSSPVTSV